MLTMSIPQHSDLYRCIGKLLTASSALIQSLGARVESRCTCVVVGGNGV